MVLLFHYRISSDGVKGKKTDTKLMLDGLFVYNFLR